MNSERCADGVAEFVRSDLVLAREDLDTFRQSGALDREAQSEGSVIDVDAAIFGKGRLVEKDPEVAAPIRFFKCRFYAVLRQFILQLQQVLNRILVISVDGNPFRALGLRIDRVQANGQFAG